MKLSISNLALGPCTPEVVGPLVRAAGIDAIEIAPTIVWPDAPRVATHHVRRYKREWHDAGVRVSGIHSLLYGHPELQVFDTTKWPHLYAHLEAMLLLARELESDVAVFGSPRNRVRGDLTHQDAEAMFSDFLLGLLPVLADYEVGLALEPNAPEYGADFITTYKDSVAVSDAVESPWVQLMIDTGCMALVNDGVVEAVKLRTPGHVHVSAPQLAPPPGSLSHEGLRQTLEAACYDGWVVLEMLPSGLDPLQTAIESARWLSSTFDKSQA